MTPLDPHGLNGQAYDYFICLGRKCKKRRAERHKIRMNRRRAKNDERRAETERVRAETKMMQQMAAPRRAPRPPVAPPVQTQGPMPMVVPNAPPQQAGMSPWVLIAGVLVIGGLLVTNRKNRQAVPITAPVPATPLPR